MIKVKMTKPRLPAKLKRDKGKLDRLNRERAATMTVFVRERIHEDGLAADGSGIGTYSTPYLDYVRKRPRIRKDGSKVEGSGTWGSDRKVILAMSRAMQNDMKLCEQDPLKTPQGYGIGFRTVDKQGVENWKKAEGLETRTYKKDIYKLTAGEKEKDKDIVAEFIKNLFST